MAHITCSAEKVAQAAEAVIKHIRDTRNARDEKAIAKAMRKKHFWSRKPFTREDAIKYLDTTDDMFGGWQSIYAHGDLHKAKTLLLLAKHGDPVVIDEDSARVLWG